MFFDKKETFEYISYLMENYLIYAIISDIHSNLESFSECLKLIPGYNIEKIVSLGDVVGYNANPNECLEIISKIKNIELIVGNHDRAVITGEYDNFSANAGSAVKWTLQNISNTNMAFLKTFKKSPQIIDADFLALHGSIGSEDNYILSNHDAKLEFKWMMENNIKLAFFGHTHYQIGYSYDVEAKEIKVLRSKTFIMDSEKYYLINPGSIGQPRDGDSRLSFIVYDSNEKSINVIRAGYPVYITKKKIVNALLPQFLADRLDKGI